MKIKELLNRIALYEYYDADFKDKIYGITDPSNVNFDQYDEVQLAKIKKMAGNDTWLTKKLTSNQLKNLGNALSFMDIDVNNTKFWYVKPDDAVELTRTEDETFESYFKKLSFYIYHKNVPAVVIVDNDLNIHVLGKNDRNSFKWLIIDKATPFAVRNAKNKREGATGFKDVRVNRAEIGRILTDIKYIWQLSDERPDNMFDYENRNNKTVDKYQSRKIRYKDLRPTTNAELKKLVQDRISQLGFECSLNDIDTSLITDMSGIFQNSKFIGDISKWDVSNVTDMSNMFAGSRFNGNISKWDVSSLVKATSMFYKSKFNKKLDKWDVSSLEDASEMFMDSAFTGDISKWQTKSLKRIDFMFNGSNFSRDLSNWDTNYLRSAIKTFKNSPLDGHEPRWYFKNRVKK